MIGAYLTLFNSTGTGIVRTGLALIILLGNISYSEWNSEKVTWDNGILEYPADYDGNRIADFSYAGYHNGNRSIPDVQPVITISPVVGDNTSHIQSAINSVSNLEPDANGIRGAVLLGPGTYDLHGSLFIIRGGVVLKGSGDGSDPENSTILMAKGNIPSKRTVIKIGTTSVSLWGNSQSDTRTNIISDTVRVGDFRFKVENPGLYSTGDNIIIVHPCTEAWLESIDYGGTHSDETEAEPGVDIPWGVGSHPIYYNRNIIAVDGNTITIDAPVFDHMYRALSQSYIYKYDGNEIIREVGVEDIRVVIENAGDKDENHAEKGMVMYGVEDSWIRNCTVQHFILSGFETGKATRVTIENCRALDPSSRIEGGKRYNFNLYRYSQLILVRNSHASNGRHHYISNGASSTSGCVFLDCTSSGAYAGSEGHRSWSQGLLYDNHVELDGPRPGVNARLLGLYNRGHYGSSHGWGSVHSVAWNCDVADGNLIVQKPPGRQNYAIGCRGSIISGVKPYASFIEPEGYIEGPNRSGLSPRSLYEAQLEARRQVVPSYNVSISIIGKGTVTVTPDPVNSTYDSSSVITLTAVPDTHWVFSHWEGALVSIKHLVQVPVLGDMEITAVFDSITTRYELVTGVVGSGTVVVNPESNTNLYDSSLVVTLEAVAAPHWRFEQWTGDTNSYSPVISVQMDSAIDLTAVFDSIECQYTINLNIIGSGYVVLDPEPVNGTYDSAQVVLLTAVASSGWEFMMWEEDLNGISLADSVVMNSDKYITAVFDSVPVGHMEIDSTWDIRAAVEYINHHPSVDTLVLISSGAEYTFQGDDPIIITTQMTIMAGNVPGPEPVITYSGSSDVIEELIRVQSGFTLRGVRLAGNSGNDNSLTYGIRLSVDGYDDDPNSPNLTITDCRISGFRTGNELERDGYGIIFEKGYIAGSVKISGTIFNDIGLDAVNITATENQNIFAALDSLSVVNCTFYEIDRFCINYASDDLPFSNDPPVIISDLTIDNCATSAILLKNSNGASVKNIIISNTSSSSIEFDSFLIDAQGTGSTVSHINIHNTPEIPVLSTGGSVNEQTIWHYDPMYLAPESNDYTLSGSSPLFGIGYYGSTPGDDRWEVNSTLSAEDSPEVPRTYHLSENYPNPFNSVTRIEITNRIAGQASITVYDLQGRNLGVVFDEHLEPGTRIVSINPGNHSTGVYIYILKINDYTAISRFTLLK